TRTTSPRPSTRPWRGPCARPSSPTRGSPACRPPRARCEGGVSDSAQPRSHGQAPRPGFSELARRQAAPAALVLHLLALRGFSLLLPGLPLAVLPGGGSDLVAR